MFIDQATRSSSYMNIMIIGIYVYVMIHSRGEIQCFIVILDKIYIRNLFCFLAFGSHMNNNFFFMESILRHMLEIRCSLRLFTMKSKAM
jgi:hypothetical protein